MIVRQLLNGDYQMSGRAVLTSEAAAIYQQCITRLMQLQGEWFLDERHGTAWREVLARRPSSAKLEQLIRQRLSGIPGLTAIENIALDWQPDSRRYAVSLDVQTAFGRFFLAQTLGLGLLESRP